MFLGCRAPEQVPQGSGPGDGTKHWSSRAVWTYGVGGAVGGQELDSMILMGPFQLRVFYDSMKWQLLILAKEEINHGFSLEA